MNTDALYERLRAQVEHENTLHNQRIVWLITMQAFLYATVGLVLQARLGERGEAYSANLDMFLGLVCAVGISVALISGQLLSNAREAMEILRQHWDDHASVHPEAKSGWYPHPSGGYPQTIWTRLLKSDYLPIVFALSWLATLAIFFHERIAGL